MRHANNENMQDNLLMPGTEELVAVKHPRIVIPSTGVKFWIPSVSETGSAELAEA